MHRSNPRVTPNPYVIIQHHANSASPRERARPSLMKQSAEIPMLRNSVDGRALKENLTAWNNLRLPCHFIVRAKPVRAAPHHVLEGHLNEASAIASGIHLVAGRAGNSKYSLGPGERSPSTFRC